MTMPAEHQEAADQVAKEQARQIGAMDATIENSQSITAVNHALVKFHESRAALRHRFATLVAWGIAVVVAWSAWAMVHWA